MTVQWTDTCSGAVVQSELQWGMLPSPPPNSGPAPAPPQDTDVMISRNGRFDGKNTFTTPKNLAPSTWYAFRVRDFDVQGIICTQWSAWTAFKTAATNQVNIEIDYSGTSVVIGSGLVGVDGTFGAFVQIPANVPPGVYLLRVVQAGATLAQTPITVVGQGQALPPILQIINPDTGLAYLGQAEAIGGYPIPLFAYRTSKPDKSRSMWTRQVASPWAR